METEVFARQIVNKLMAEGYTAYYAGGWVRDYVMGHPSSDIDIATNAPPQKILDLFPRTLLIGLSFGVVIILHEGHQFEVSTFRRDIGYEGGRRPTGIEFCDAREDAIRRDFTINGMFYNPVEDQIIDYVGGTDDIKRQVVRTIGDPQERFSEDRLRMIRAIRFSSRFGFIIDPATQEGIIQNAETLFPAVAMERVWQEFNKMAPFPRFDHALIELHRFGLLPVIFPALQNTHLREIKHRAGFIAHFPKGTPTIVYLMELFPDSTLSHQLEICRYLKASNQDAKLVEYIFRMREMAENERKGKNHVDLYAWAVMYANPLHQVCLEVISARFDPAEREEFLRTHWQRKTQLLPHTRRIDQKKWALSAETLKSYGLVQGKQMGDMMKEAERIAVSYNLSDEEAILKLLKLTPTWEKFEKGHHD